MDDFKLRFKDDRVRVYRGSCIDVMKHLIEKGVKVDSIVTDPPYGIDFMNQGWDAAENVAFQKKTWRLAFKLLKPGGYMVAFSGTRTYHRMVCAIEDAGFEIRDQLAWMYGSGFPKSRSITKDIDKIKGIKYQVIGLQKAPGFAKLQVKHKAQNLTKTEFTKYDTTPQHPTAVKYKGYGTALKPAWEPIVLARKPLSEKNIALNVLKHGTGAINIDGCRIGSGKRVPGSVSKTNGKIYGKGLNNQNGTENGHNPNVGRWPANIVHDGSEEVLEYFYTYGEKKSTGGQIAHVGMHKFRDAAKTLLEGDPGYNDTGTIARYFYSAKAGKDDRHGSDHPTVKPVALMKWLVTLINPPGGKVLDPFCGSGSTVVAALRVPNAKAIGIELQKKYVVDIIKRVEHVKSNPTKSKKKPLMRTDTAMKSLWA
jgi:DNA modification methylase